ncbi:UNVERIFIED_ORG: hypothetical protein J2740_005371 [Rhizobium nepotum]|nr:hypothetical protein [Rhizobium nepotum]
MSQWESLFDQAASIINQANSSFKLLDSWTFGGGTALMLQINHRESFDIDIFVDDPQVLPYLNPTTQGYTLQVNPDEYVSDGTHALKIVFAGIGEIDFICAPSLTNDPTSRVAVRGIQVDLEPRAKSSRRRFTIEDPLFSHVTCSISRASPRHAAMDTFSKLSCHSKTGPPLHWQSPREWMQASLAQLWGSFSIEKDMRVFRKLLKRRQSRF